MGWGHIKALDKSPTEAWRTTTAHYRNSYSYVATIMITVDVTVTVNVIVNNMVTVNNVNIIVRLREFALDSCHPGPRCE